MAQRQQSIDIVFKNIKYSVRDKADGKMKPILHGVSGQIKAGECLALMGASGAGKTTLLNILAGRIQKDKDNDLTGEVLFNGKSYQLNEISSFSGYVLQSDILLEFLTVKETLQFGANLKIKGSEEQKQERANKLISEFKLEGTENTLVGGQFVKGISGGQKKRVNIALELISDPPVLFLDEPTSGLDSYTSEIVIKKLDELAKKFNKTIIYVIHQPSSDIFKQMDKLMLLYKGKAIYYGGAGKTAVDYFGKIGFKCETDMNPSDFFMYIMQSKNQELAGYLDQNYKEQVGVVIDSKLTDKIELRKNDFPGVGSQFSALFKRSVKMLLRNPVLTLMRVGQILGMSFFFCSVFFQISEDEKDPLSVFNRNGGLFFAAVSSFIPAMMAQLITCKFAAMIDFSWKSLILLVPAERKVFVKEYKSRFYSVFPYYLAKNLIEVPFSFIFPMAFTAIIYYISGFHAPFENFLKFGKYFLSYFDEVAFLLINLTFCATGIGILIGCVFNELEVALNVAPLIFFPMLLFSGFYVNSDSVRSWVKWLEYASPIRYALESLVYNEFEGTKYTPNPINFLNFKWGYWSCMLYLIIIGGGIRTIGFFALLINARNA